MMNPTGRREFLTWLGAGAAAMAWAPAGSAAEGKPLRGLFPIGQTPCTPDNKIDLDCLAAEIKFCSPNAYWFEMPHPCEYADRPYHKDKFRVDKDGYVHAPTAPGLGYPFDRAVLDKMTKRIDT